MKSVTSVNTDYHNCQEGNSENLTEKQKEVLGIWNDLNTNEQETVMSMHVDFRSRRTVRVYVSAVLFYF